MLELKARLATDPEQDLVATLVSEHAPLDEALLRLAAFHGQTPAEQIALRAEGIRAGEHHFPIPGDVPTMLVFFLDRVQTLMMSTTTPLQDLQVMGFAIRGILQIHPFAQANGRTSLAFGSFLLGLRWGRPVPLFETKDAQRTIGPIVVGEPVWWDGRSPEGYQKLRQALLLEWAEASLTSIPNLAGIGALADELLRQVT